MEFQDLFKSNEKRLEKVVEELTQQAQDCMYCFPETGESLCAKCEIALLTFCDQEMDRFHAK